MTDGTRRKFSEAARGRSLRVYVRLPPSLSTALDRHCVVDAPAGAPRNRAEVLKEALRRYLSAEERRRGS